MSEPYGANPLPEGTTPIDKAIRAYQDSLDSVATDLARSPEQLVLSILLARQAVAEALATAKHLLSADVACLSNLDQRLRASAPTLTGLVDPETLAGWRNSVAPLVRGWWWSLDQIADQGNAGSKNNEVWAVAAVTCLAVSVGITTEVWQRFQGVGIESFGLVSILGQVLLTLFAGSTFTRSGREFLQRLVNRFGIHRKYQARWTALLALVVLLVILAFRLSLPSIARLYNNYGERLRRQNKVSSALTYYQWAVALNPDSSAAYYNLASGYEDVLDYDKAATAYQRAIRSAPSFYAAYNNLAHLLILRRQDCGSALRLINMAFEMKASERSILYSLYKNRGWAFHCLKLYGQAEDDLREALELRSDGGAAYCLLAQVLEVRRQNANPVWENCIAYSPGQESEIEASWLAMARERLRKKDQR